jgi:uncharacterized protein
MSKILITKAPTMYTEAPINPQWILQGRPIARGALMSETADASVTTVMWDCTAGIFNWHYDIDEVVYILEGSVIISEHATGQKHYLKVGDSILFPRGSSATWSVDNYVRKLAVLHSPLPKKYLLAQRIWRAMKGIKRSASNLEGIAV